MKQNKVREVVVEEHGDMISKVKDMILKPRSKWFVGVILGMLLIAVLSPIILPAIYPDTSQLDVDVFPSPATFANGTEVYGVTWNPRYVELIVQIQMHAKSTSIEDIHLVFDFDAAILAVGKGAIVGVTNPSVGVEDSVRIILGGQIVNDIKYSELNVDIEKLDKDGLYALRVVLDPDYRGTLFRSHVISNPTSRYFGSFQYVAYGVTVRKEANGNITSVRK